MTTDLKRQAQAAAREAENDAWVRSQYPQDLGEGVRLRWMLSGDILTWHRRPKDDFPCGTFVRLEGKNATHALTAGDRDTPTISPNVTCGLCGHSGFIREGRWVPL